MKAYGIRKDYNDWEDFLNKSSFTNRHGSGNPASKRAYRRIPKRRARAAAKAEIKAEVDNA